MGSIPVRVTSAKNTTLFRVVFFALVPRALSNPLGVLRAPNRVRTIASPLPRRKPCRARRLPARVSKQNISELFRITRLVRICFFTECVNKNAESNCLPQAVFTDIHFWKEAKVPKILTLSALPADVILVKVGYRHTPFLLL